MEFMDHLYQFGQFGILTFRDGIQEVGGLISSKRHVQHKYPVAIPIGNIRSFSHHPLLRNNVIDFSKTVVYNTTYMIQV